MRRSLFAALVMASPLMAEEAPPAPAFFVVAAPVADLRAEPKRMDGAAALKSPYVQDPLQESQLLYGERVKLLVDKGAWVLVEAVEQAEYTHADAWTGYPGWVVREALVPEPAGYKPDAVVAVRYAKLAVSPSRKSDGLFLPAGARVQVTFRKGDWARVRRPDGTDGWMKAGDIRSLADLPSEDSARRAAVLAAARLFLGEPYYWGGRAGHREGDVETPSGMDCSGLVNVAYALAGAEAPRDSHEQFMRSRPLDVPSELKPGDLIFLAWTKNPQKITHVMIYAGGDQVLEAVQEQNVVRQVAVKEKLGKALKDIAVLEPVGERHVYFGRLLPE